MTSRRRATEDDEDDVLEPAAADEDAVSDAGDAREEEDEAGKPDEEGVQRHTEDDAGEEAGEEDEEDEELEAVPAIDELVECEAAVPTKGAFYMHDDRMGGGRAPPPRRAGSSKKEEMLWCHDKFEELMREPELPPRTRSESGRGGGRGGRADRGGRGAGKGRGGRVDAPNSQQQPAVPAPPGSKRSVDARVVASKGGGYDASAEPGPAKSQGRGGRGIRAVQAGLSQTWKPPGPRPAAEALPVASGGASAAAELACGTLPPDAAGGYADATAARGAGRGIAAPAAPLPATVPRGNGYSMPRRQGHATAQAAAGLNRSAMSFQPQYQLPSGMAPMAAGSAGLVGASVPPAGIPAEAMQGHRVAKQPTMPALAVNGMHAHWAGEHASVPALSADAMQAQWAAEQHGMMSPYATHGYGSEYTDLSHHYYAEAGMPVGAGIRGGMGMAISGTMAGGMAGMGGAYMGSAGYGVDPNSCYGGEHGTGRELSPAATYHTSGLFTPEHMTRLRYEQGDVGLRGRRPNLELNIDGYSLSTTRMGMSVLVPTGTRKVTIEKPAEA
jgi:hypothetical protein